MSQSTRGKLIEIARSMIDGEVGLIEGSREIVRLHRLLGDADSEPMLTIIGFESETDDFPLGEARDRWNSDTLERQDRERDEYLADAHDALLTALRAIATSGEE